MDDSTELEMDMSVSEKNEEDILNLTDIVEKGPEFIDKDLDQKLYANDEIAKDTIDNEIIDLNSTIEDDYDKNDIDEPDLLNMSLELPGMKTDESSPAESINIDNNETTDNLEITDNQLEAVLEKIIKEKFSQKIETILFQVVEKMVAKEIEDIKRTMAE